MRKLEVFEHIGALRYAGLVGVQIEGDGWPHYDGCAEALWNLVKANSKSTSVPLKTYTVKKPVRRNYPNRFDRNGIGAYTEVHPSVDGGLRVEVSVDYPGIGYLREMFRFPNDALFEEISKVRTVGLGASRYWFARLCRVFGWPHFDAVNWPKLHDNKMDLLQKIVRHRLLDILGALSLLCRDGIFVGDVRSHCSGHQADIDVVQSAGRHLIEICP